MNNDFSRISKAIESTKVLTREEVYALRKMLDGKLKKDKGKQFFNTTGFQNTKSITNMFLDRR